MEDCGAHHRRGSITRELALSRVRELRAQGLQFREIGHRFRVHASVAPRGGRRPGSGAFLRALDAVDQPLALYTADGRPIHRNRRLRDMLAAPSTHGLDREMELAVQHAAALARLRGLTGNHRVLEDIAVQEVPRADGAPATCLRVSLVGFDLFGEGATLLLNVQPARADRLSDHALRHRFMLTRQEARIARLIASGRRNDEIAQELCISPHTVRRHTEQVFQKLGVSSRSQVPARLLSDEHPG